MMKRFAYLGKIFSERHTLEKELSRYRDV